MKPNDLKLCIEALNALREEMRQEMNTSVAGKLEEVILRLEDLLEAGDQDVDVPIGTRLEALRVLADVLQVVTNVSDLIRQWASML
jgi:hypothetical protein